ncbi:porin [Hylemonella gracilis]|uniref:Porin domain-containing protein n=1 Tax=Hylemonella gracilis ATCC 19624 TaxID=887062 RepID=F3KP66_9BURK|nr:porin [Hylemonella gracilis]EGI78467.1 hypothetical protein HGR_01086 [Hylemonella gracilis ATCC 19624]
MKKTLIAVAALTAAVGAMADLKITGEVDTTVRLTDTGANSTTTVGRDGRGTTNVTFQGSEDLGDGLKAIFLYEHDFSPFESNGVFLGGEKFAGLQGGFGTLRLGTPNAVVHNVNGAVRYGMFGTKDGGRATAGGTTAGGTNVIGNDNTTGSTSNTNSNTVKTVSLFGIAETRYNSSIRYDSPSLSGLVVSLNYVPASEKTGNGKDGQATSSLIDAGAIFKTGGLTVAAAFNSRSEDESSAFHAAAAPTAAQTIAGAKRDYITAGVAYDFGFATIGGGYHQLSYDGDTLNTGYNVQATVPLSEALKLGLQYQTLTYDDKFETYAKTLGGDEKQFAIGLDYSLSKNTAVYARYISTSLDEKIKVVSSDVKANDSVTTTLFGLSVKF